jgi:hypothetical protein
MSAKLIQPRWKLAVNDTVVTTHERCCNDARLASRPVIDLPTPAQAERLGSILGTIFRRHFLGAGYNSAWRLA